MLTEEWKDIEGYDGLYQVSNFGNVKSYDKSWLTGPKGGALVTRRGQLLIPQTKNGYSSVNLYKDRKMSSRIVHRMVAIAFIPNPENKPQVNHIDYNRKNNHIENLEWSTVKENSLHSFDNYIEHSLSQLKIINDSGFNKKPVLKMNKKGEVLQEYESASAASIDMVGKVTATISQHINDKLHRKSAYGYVWAYKN